MNKIIVIRGPSGTGKTSVSRIIREKIGNVAIVSPDTFYHEVFKEAQRELVYESISILTDYYISKKFTVIIDGLLPAFYEGKLDIKLKRIAKKYNINIYRFFLNSNFEDLLERNKTRPNLKEEDQKKWYESANKSIMDDIVLETKNTKPTEIARKILRIIK